MRLIECSEVAIGYVGESRTRIICQGILNFRVAFLFEGLKSHRGCSNACFELLLLRLSSTSVLLHRCGVLGVNQHLKFGHLIRTRAGTLSLELLLIEDSLAFQVSRGTLLLVPRGVETPFECVRNLLLHLSLHFHFK